MTINMFGLKRSLQIVMVACVNLKFLLKQENTLQNVKTKVAVFEPLPTRTCLSN